MSKFEVGAQVYVLVNGDRVPGIVRDPEAKLRELPTRNRGLLRLHDSIEVTSYRTPPNAPAFYTTRPEVEAFVTPRTDPLPFIDGPAGTTVEKLLAALDVKVGESMQALQRRLAEQAGRETTTTDWTKVKGDALTV